MKGDERMKNRNLRIFLVLQVIFLLAGCGKDPNLVARNHSYTIVRKDGIPYLSFHERPSAPAYLDPPTFSSAAELRRGILEGDFTEEQLYALCYQRGPNEDGLWRVCDPDVLYDLQVPVDMEVRKLRWWGHRYEFLLYDGNALCGNVESCTKDKFEEALEEIYTDKREELFVTDHRYLEEQGADIYHSHRKTTVTYRERFIVKKNGWTMYVKPEWGTKWGRYLSQSGLFLFWTNGSEYFLGTISHGSPADAWLASFDFVPCKS